MAKINKSLYKIPLVGGIERIPAIILVVSFFIIILYSPLFIKIVGIVTIVSLWGVLIKLNANDAIFISILTTYVRQQKFYYAHSRESSKIINKKYKFKV